MQNMKLTKPGTETLLLAAMLAFLSQNPALAVSTKAMPQQKVKPDVKAVGPVGMEGVTAATGGEAIPASSAGGAWTTLAGPVIAETYARDAGGPGLGTIVLTAPAGFEFNPHAKVRVRVDGEGHKTINLVPDGGAIPAAVTSKTVTIRITCVSRGGLAFPDKLTFQNIQVRPIAGTRSASGNLTETGTCQFRHLSLSSGGWGVLREVGGAVPNLILADPLGDWDGDGRSNLIEYALGTDPNNPTDNAKGMNVWILDDGGNKYLALGYNQRTNIGASLQYLPEVSSDKQAWFSDSSHILSISVSAVDSQFNWVVVRDTMPLSPTTPRFIRLTVIQN